MSIMIRAPFVLGLPQGRCDSMARAMLLIGFAAAASADTGPSARQLRGYAANATSLAQAQTCSTKGNYCQPSIDGKPPISCCGELACKQIIGGKECGWPATCAAPGETCYDSVDGKPPLTCCGDSVCTQIIGGKQCKYPDTCAAPGQTCYDSVDGRPPLTCCDGYECQQIIGGKRCASNRGLAAEETTTALPPSDDVNTTAGVAPTSGLFQGLSSGPSYYCGGTWNGNNNWGSNYEGPIVNTDTETCKWLCGVSGSNKCTGWTVTNNNECYLKTSVGDMQSDTGVQGSGYCYPSCGDQQNQQNNDGHNYEGPIQVQNAEFCKVRCQASGGQCKGWTVTNNGECYLKDSVGPMRPDGGVQASGNC